MNLTPHLLDPLTHCFVFCVLSLLQHLALFIDFACNLLDFLANVFKLVFNQGMGIVDFASPRFPLAVDPLILITIFRLNDVQEYFRLTIDLLLFGLNDTLHRS